MLERRNLGTPDEVLTFPNGRVEIVRLGGLTLGRAVFEPGWRWSQDVAPIAKTPSCQAPHAAVVISGRMHVRMDDGRELDLGAGDAHVVGPGHDAWVVGDEPLVAIDVIGLEEFARPEAEATQHTLSCPCGVVFTVASEDAVEHLLAAVTEHAAGSHGHAPTREHLLSEMTTGRGEPAAV